MRNKKTNYTTLLCTLSFFIFLIINTPLIAPNRLNTITIKIILSFPNVKKYENIGEPKVDPKFPN